MTAPSCGFVLSCLIGTNACEPPWVILLAQLSERASLSDQTLSVGYRFTRLFSKYCSKRRSSEMPLSRDLGWPCSDKWQPASGNSAQDRSPFGATNSLHLGGSTHGSVDCSWGEQFRPAIFSEVEHYVIEKIFASLGRRKRGGVMRCYWEQIGILGPVYRLMGRGLGDNDIAQKLGVTELSVQHCITWMLHFLRLDTREELVMQAATGR